MSKKAKPATANANAKTKEKQAKAKAAMTPEQKAFLDGDDNLGLEPAKTDPKKAETAKVKKAAADELGLGEEKAPRKPALTGKKLTATDEGLKARGVRGLVCKAAKGGAQYDTVVRRLLEDDAFKAPRSKKFADDRDAYAKNRIARMVAIDLITVE